MFDKDSNLTTIDESHGSPVLVMLLDAITKTSRIRPGETACHLTIFENLQYDLVVHNSDYNVENLSNHKRWDNRRLWAGKLCLEFQTVTRYVVVGTAANTTTTSRHGINPRCLLDKP
ncbi:hypothetical protein [Acidithiobacillus sp. AMEEHan]|uniref:hypothetical protein n=1 Tax=Acidithiobacillus sp. AMEEHan TaxID=2994951 RepID=UPI0027E43D94|nr:hypothetical protein [Acidithiobacillus sp. AMEEHan]